MVNYFRNENFLYQLLTNKDINFLLFFIFEILGDKKTGTE